MKKNMTILLAGTSILAMASSAYADEVKIGDTKIINGMNVAAVYLQPVEMYPAMAMHGGSDIHLEADISAAPENKHGFEEGAWIPYLTISYHLKKQGSEWEKSGSFMAMVANDGPHYGKNVKLDGAGAYSVTYHIDPPIMQGLYRHTDKETGVAPWWHGFDVSWDFNYIGIGKKGGY